MTKSYISFLKTYGFLIAIFTLFPWPDTAHGGERRFAFSYEAKRYVPGEVELENWITWKTDDAFDRIDFRHELEFGVTERLQIGLYLANWRWQDGEGSEYRNSAVEAIYNIFNPYEDPFGFSLYGEVKFGDDFLELESKVILQKNVGDWAIAYNLIIESEWEDEGLSTVKGELANTLGISYLVNPRLGFGLEALYEVEIEEWEDFGKSAVYLGPNMTARFGRAWITAAGLFEVTSTDEPDFQLRAITGWHF